MKRVLLSFVPCLALIVASSCSQGEQPSAAGAGATAAIGAGATGATSSSVPAGGSAPASACPAGQKECGSICVMCKAKS